jgi:predicted DNA-binding antitoxin AbrB/MazE fold protein
MTITVEATYENGTLKLKEPLPLKEHERVHVTVETRPEIQAALEAVERSYGLIRWTGDPKVIERVALEPEFGIREAP